MSKKAVDGLKNIDWEFEDDDTSFATHNIHRYSSKYIPQIPEALIRATTNKGDVILDPFLGSGTTLLEANRLSRNSIGIDINPVALLISEVKTIPVSINKLDLAIKNFVNIVSPRIAISRNLSVYSRNNSNVMGKISFDLADFQDVDRWYQKNVLVELSIIRDYINKSLHDDKLKKTFACAFSAIVRPVSNTTSGFGNLMIDKNKRKITNTFEVYENHLLKTREAIVKLTQIFKPKYAPKIYQADATDLSFLSDNSIDSVITHPPYIAAVPYAEYLRLSLLWIQESFSYMYDKELSKYLDYKKLDQFIVGGGRHKKDVVSRFESSMTKAFSEMYRVLKPKKYCSVVIGNPIVKGELIRCDQMFIKIAENNGFTTEAVIKRGKHRTTMGKMKDEYILIFKK